MYRYFLPILLILISVAWFPIRGWEPAEVDVTQQKFAPSSDGVDHLEPSRTRVDDGYYLVHFGYYPAMEYQDDFFTITRRESDGAYVLKTWSEWAQQEGKPPKDHQLPSPVEMVIPQDIALSLYEMWVNALHEVRYDRASYMPLDGWGDVFSAFVRGKGWMAGSAVTPEKALPPKWLEDAAKAVLQLAKDHNVDACRKKLAEIHDKLYAYWKAHGVSLNAPPMHR